VRTGSAGHPLLPYLGEAGVEVTVDARPDPAGLARAAQTGPVVWLAAQDGDEELLRAIGHAALALDDPPVIEVVPGSYDLPGARVLDLVRVMDRLRTGCPWDSQQTHESLVPYLLEESYEVLETIEEGDYGALREELGDVLLQVAFHSRVAQDRPGDEGGFDIDDVADAIVAKLVRRHPHVFGGVTVSGAGEVADNWDAIKAAEAIESGDRAHIREELGDVLLQVVFQSRVGEEHPDDPFDIDDVAAGIVEKLVRRHPHVFADTDATTPEEVERNWELIKAQERAAKAATAGEATHPGGEAGHESLLHGIPASLSTLLVAEKVLARLERTGGDLSVATGGEDVGARLLALVAQARADGESADALLRKALRELSTQD
jgi:NTP pyrophosphatase (non-canonical NTP hydrolase)